MRFLVKAFRKVKKLIKNSKKLISEIKGLSLELWSRYTFKLSDLDAYIYERKQKLGQFIDENPDREEWPLHDRYRLMWNESVYYLGEYYLERGETEKAIHFFSKVSMQMVEYAKKAHFQIGNIYLNILNEPDKAIESFNKASLLGDTDSNILIAVAKQQIACKKANTQQASSSEENTVREVKQFLTIQDMFQLHYLPSTSRRNEMLSNTTQGAGNSTSAQETELSIVPAAGTLPAIATVSASTSGLALQGQPQTQPININLSGPPRHITRFNNLISQPYPTDVSEFYKKVQEIVQRCKADLEKEKWWFLEFSEKTHKMRMEDIKLLEGELNSGPSKIYLNDVKLIQLCQSIANQEVPFLFGYSDLPNALKNVLYRTLVTGFFQVNLVGNRDYQDLQNQLMVSESNNRNYIKQNNELLHENKEHKEKIKKLEERLDKQENEINELKNELKIVKEVNAKLVKENEKYRKKYNRYVGVQNQGPSLFKPHQPEDEPPSYLICPISRTLMKEPVYC